MGNGFVFHRLIEAASPPLATVGLLVFGSGREVSILPSLKVRVIETFISVM